SFALLSYLSHRRTLAGQERGDLVGGTQVVRENVSGWFSPRGIPSWLSYCASGFVALIVAWSLVIGGSSLPAWFQIGLGALTVLPWLPGARDKLPPAAFVALSTVPTLVLTWTGGSAIMFGALAVAAARVAIATTIPRSAFYAAGAVSIIIGCQFVAGHSSAW